MVAHQEVTVVYNDYTTDALLQIVIDNFKECCSIVAKEEAELCLIGTEDGHHYCTVTTNNDMKTVCETLNEFVLQKALSEKVKKELEISIPPKPTIVINEFAVLKGFLQTPLTHHLLDKDHLTSLKSYFDDEVSPFSTIDNDNEKLLLFHQCFQNLQQMLYEHNWPHLPRETRQIINFCHAKFFKQSKDRSEDGYIIPIDVVEQYSDGTHNKKTAILRIHDNTIVHFKLHPSTNKTNTQNNKEKVENYDEITSLFTKWFPLNFRCLKNPCYPCDYLFATICVYFNMIYQDYRMKIVDKMMSTNND